MARAGKFIASTLLRLHLTLNPLTWKIWWAPNNASKWQMGFNSAFKGLNSLGSSTRETLTQTSSATDHFQKFYFQNGKLALRYLYNLARN